MRVKMSKPPLPAPTVSAIGPCPTVVKFVGRPGTGSLPSTIAPPDHPPLGWSGGAKVLGKLPVPGRHTILIIVGQGPTALAVGAGGGCLDIFTLIYPFSSLSPSLWKRARYRLKYCLKGPLNPKQPTNHPGASYNLDYSRARAYCTCSRCGLGLFGHFYSYLSFLSSFSLSLGDGPV